MSSDSPPLPDREEPESGSCLRSLGGFLLALGIFLLLLGVGGGFMAYLLPKEYLGRCIVAIERQDSGPVTNKFVATQFQAITSTDALDSVVENTNLAKLWSISKEAAREKLEGNIEVENMRGTDLLGIEVRDKDAALAAELANEIAEEYSRRVGNQRSVIIHEKAILDEHSVSPNTKMYLIIAMTLGALGLISGILGIVFLCVAPRSMVSTNSLVAP
jgi:capsular polysaccharide biosynthesis protein